MQGRKDFREIQFNWDFWEPQRGQLDISVSVKEFLELVGTAETIFFLFY